MSFLSKILLLFLAIVLIAAIETNPMMCNIKVFEGPRRSFEAKKVSGNEEEDPHRATREKCGKELGFTQDDLKLGKDNPEPYKCYIYCFLKELNIMDAFGNFYPETAVNAISEDLRDASRPSVFKCYERTEGGNELCEHAYDVIKCFAEDSPEIYQLFGIFSAPGQNQQRQQEEQQRQHRRQQQ